MSTQEQNMKTKTLFKNISKLPNDALFAIKGRMDVDTRPHKVGLGIGAYRDNNGKPWILPSVRKAEKIIQSDPEYNHEYSNISGLDALRKHAARILFGDAFDCANRVVNVQSLSGTRVLKITSDLADFSEEMSVASNSLVIFVVFKIKCSKHLLLGCFWIGSMVITMKNKVSKNKISKQ